MSKSTTARMISGGKLDFANPKPDQFTIADVALGLAREARFNGQTPDFYSVAQHSVLVSCLVPPEYAMWGLLHDGEEFAVRDICPMLKALLGPSYVDIADRVRGAVYQSAGLPAEPPPDVKHLVKLADTQAITMEVRDLWPDPREWEGELDLLIELPEYVVRPMEPKEAHAYFLARYFSITQNRPFVMDLELWERQHEVPSEASRTRARMRA
ncbi:metal-dependent phosphohydrolase [Achromobacter denitrificans]